MKKTITKLVLRSETVKLLAASELARAAGAGAETCRDTVRLSTCPQGAEPGIPNLA